MEIVHDFRLKTTIIKEKIIFYDPLKDPLLRYYNNSKWGNSLLFKNLISSTYYEEYQNWLIELHFKYNISPIDQENMLIKWLSNRPQKILACHLV